MCGIVGVYGISDKNLVKRMCNRIVHRGPDDEGYYVDDYVSLGMRRLSIIDLSTGKQPIFNEDGSIVVVFNGEIYNFREIRKELEQRGHRFYTNTDTEVIVHAYEEYGYDCLKKFNGMFGIALWDANKKELFIARDRIGIKPLYYTVVDGNFIFSSEIKCILECGVGKTIDKIALANYFALRYIPAPRTIFEGIKKLEPGHYMVIRNGNIEKKRYWRLEYKPNDGGEEYFTEKVLEMLKTSVRRRLVSDVPLGAFLSGGIDSSTVVALMSELMDEPVKTFSVGFEGEELDETPYARIVAEHFGTDHHEIFVDINDLSILPKIIYHLDEPLADPAVIPTYLISELARKKVKVVLTGEGGDEAFGGYEKYLHEQRMLKILSCLPDCLRRLCKKLGARLEDRKNKLGLYLSFIGAKSNQEESYYFRLKNIDWGSCWLVNGGKDEVRELVRKSFDNRDYISNMLYYDIQYWLPDDLLMKIDKMTMAKSLEARVPYLDYEFLQFAYNIPPRIKLGNSGKYILKKAVQKILPKEIIYRKKHGFDVPISRWFREDNDLIQKYMDESILKEVEYINVKEVYRLWDLHKRGKDFGLALWKVLCYSIWYSEYIF